MHAKSAPRHKRSSFALSCHSSQDLGSSGSRNIILVMFRSKPEIISIRLVNSEIDSTNFHKGEPHALSKPSRLEVGKVHGIVRAVC